MPGGISGQLDLHVSGVTLGNRGLVRRVRWLTQGRGVVVQTKEIKRPYGRIKSNHP